MQNVQMKTADSSIDLESVFLVPNYDIHIQPDHATAYPANGAKTFGVMKEDEYAKGEHRGYKIHKFMKYPGRLRLRQLQMVNSVGRDVYLLADGTRKAEDIYSSLIEQYEQPYGTQRESVYKYIQHMVRIGHLIPSPVARPTRIRRTGCLDRFYPPHISVEVTSRCNIRCIHCYGAFGAKIRDNALDITRLIEFLEQMKANGLTSIELTGGECTIHPEFTRLLKWCVANLDMIGILTNGVAIPEEAFEIMIAHADKVLGQICINGDEEYHTRFTKSPVAYRRAIASLERLAKGGVFIRAPMNLTFENYTQIVPTAMKMMDIGAATFGASFVDVSYGRAKDLMQPEEKDGCSCGGSTHQAHNPEARCAHVVAGMTCAERLEAFKWAKDTLSQLQEQYPGFVRYEHPEDLQRMAEFDRGCGAGRRTFYITSNGRVKLCPMAAEVDLPDFGDLQQNDFHELMGAPFAKHMSHIPAPNPEHCGDCKHLLTDRGCILHGLMQYVQTPEECPWAEKTGLSTLFGSRNA